MLTCSSPQTQSIPDLAASLTDCALELLGGFRPRGDSVEVELDVWHALTTELERERPVQRMDLKRAVNRAALRVAAERTPLPQYQSLRVTNQFSHV